LLIYNYLPLFVLDLNPSEEMLVASNASFSDAILQYNLLPPESVVTEEELRMLGLNPEELFEQSNVHDSYYSTSINYDVGNNLRISTFLFDNTDESEVDDDDYDVEENDIDDIDDIMQDIDFGYRSNSNFPVVFSNPLSGYSRENEFEIEYPLTDDDDDDGENVEDNDTGGEEEDNDEDNDTGGEEEDNEVSTPWPDGSDISSSDEESENVHDSTPHSFINDEDSDLSDQSDSWNMGDDEMIDVIAVTGSSYSEDSSNSSQSVISLNDSNLSTSTSSNSSSSSSSSSSSF